MVSFDGPFVRRPTTYELEKIKEAVLGGCSLEEVYGLSLTAPSVTGAREILGKVDLPDTIDREYWLPCAICSVQNPKFKSGTFLWCDDGWVRLIGFCCAHKHFGYSFQNVIKRRTAALTKEGDMEFLIQNLHRQGDIPGKLESLAQKAAAVSRWLANLKKEVPELYATLRSQAAEHPGKLCVYRKHRSGPRVRTSFGESQYEAVPVASIQGFEALQSAGGFGNSLLKIREKMAQLPHTTSEDESLEVVAQNESAPENLRQWVRTIENVRRNIVDLERKVLSAARFFEPDNLQNIQKWASMPDSPANATVDINQGLMIVRRNDGSGTSVVRLDRAS